MAACRLVTPAAPFLNLTAAAAADQWRGIVARDVKPKGTRQVNYAPVEVVTALALLLVVDPKTQGWGTFHPLVDQVARLCRRPPSSLVEKERNLTGARPNAGTGERALFQAVIEHPDLVFGLWSVALQGARLAGIGPDQLPDILDADGAEPGLLGQEELSTDLADLVAEDRGAYEAAGLDRETSERAAMAMARLGQHRFARTVRSNYAHKCGFCGFNTTRLPASRLLVASHVKPWRAGTTKERLDPLNGVAACPTHDAAFDTGLLTVTADGRIHTARLLREATEQDQAAHAMFTGTVSEQLIVDPSYRPGPHYLDWHHEHIWRNGVHTL